MVERLGMRRIRLHDLRHTWATLALQAGVPLKVVSERLGHATTAVTADTYSHVAPGMQTDAAERVAALIFGSALVVLRGSSRVNAGQRSGRRSDQAVGSPR
jgi:hypothetical protein